MWIEWRARYRRFRDFRHYGALKAFVFACLAHLTVTESLTYGLLCGAVFGFLVSAVLFVFGQ